MDQLITISKTLQELVDYEEDVCGGDYSNAIAYSKIKDSVDQQIWEIEN